jgi:Cu-Zn family superoxide dismutase
LLEYFRSVKIIILLVIKIGAPMKNQILSVALSVFVCCAQAESVVIPMYETSPAIGSQGFVGNVMATDTPYGLMLTPHLSGLTPYLVPGPHGFHVHVNPSCAENGMAAGGHLDPDHTNLHLGPYNTHGHLGDLPVLSIAVDGTASVPVVAPRLTVKEILGHSLMIHSGSDNYTDEPKLGGGGTRMICGVIPVKSGLLISSS